MHHRYYCKHEQGQIKGYRRTLTRTGKFRGCKEVPVPIESPEFPEEERIIGEVIRRVHVIGWDRLLREIAKDGQLFVADFLNDHDGEVLAEMIRNRFYYFGNKTRTWTFQASQPKNVHIYIPYSPTKLTLIDYMNRKHLLPLRLLRNPYRYELITHGEPQEMRSKNEVIKACLTYHSHDMPI
jgi:hypothetical protein